MHASIAALSQGVPTVALAYSPKTLNVIGDGLKYPSVLDIRSSREEDFRTNTNRLVRTLIVIDDETRAYLMERISSMRILSKTNMTLLVQELSEHNLRSPLN